MQLVQTLLPTRPQPREVQQVPTAVSCRVKAKTNSLYQTRRIDQMLTEEAVLLLEMQANEQLEP